MARWRGEEAGVDDTDARLPVVRGASPQKALNVLRKRSDAGALRAHRGLAAAAKRHARGCCEEGRIGHVLQPGDDPEARLLGEGIRARAVGEVTARAGDPAAAFVALQHSPSHRWTLLDRRFTDVGIGIARDGRGRACLVIVLAAWPRAF